MMSSADIPKGDVKSVPKCVPWLPGLLSCVFLTTVTMSCFCQCTQLMGTMTNSDWPPWSCVHRPSICPPSPVTVSPDLHTPGSSPGAWRSLQIFWTFHSTQRNIGWYLPMWTKALLCSIEISCFPKHSDQPCWSLLSLRCQEYLWNSRRKCS